MTIQSLPYNEVPQFSARDKAYVLGDPRLKPFYKYEVKLERFAAVIEDKKKDNTNRALLVDVLQKQYQQLNSSPQTLDHIQALSRPNTFTVTTAHQPSLFTGPLYYIYKIFSAINLAEQLAAAYPEYQFVPIFITGGEDHDFEEMNHLHLFGKTIVWENEESGPVGMMSSKKLLPVLEKTKEVLGDSPNAQVLCNILDTAVEQYDDYSGVARHLTNELFKDYGLVILDTNDPQLKQAFIPYIQKEILEQASKPFVERTTKALEEAGFSQQAYPRDINFFYLQKGSRSRIEEVNGTYKVLDSDIEFTKETLIEEINTHPERFSPNVVMRPIYQELVLPNLAYIGGGGEIAYWLERKSQFKHFGLNYPMLIRRNSVLFVDKGSKKKLDKLELNIRQLFEDIEIIIKEYVRENTENEISLKEEKAQLDAIFDKVEAKAREVDASLVKAAAAEAARQKNSLAQLEGKLMRAEKQRHDIAINQMRSLKDKLFPGNGLQERYDNFMGFYLKYGTGFFDVLKAELNPMNKELLIITDE
jgi:bacillithiol biosynthesis cysteine-adding enzyme BshC